MRKPKVLAPCVAVFLFLLNFSQTQPARAQKPKAAPAPAGPLIKRTTARHETYRFPFGSTLTFSGPPAGSLVIEGWERSELELSASIELEAPTAADLDRIAALNNFYVDEDSNHIRILTTGTHDREFMKRNAKNFPKTLLGLPWKIDYQIKVPNLTDLSINAGIGPVKLTGVEGTIVLNALQSNADLSLTGGLVAATIQSGTVNLTIPTRAWHGLGSEIRLASGNLNIDLLPGFNADINADVLRLGEIRNTYSGLLPAVRDGISQKSIRGRAGGGGATLTFTVGDGVIVIKQNGE